jgi:hypothetical protein
MWDFLLGVFALGIGAVLLFGGYRLALILLPIWGFFAGFYLGAGAMQALFGEGFLSTVVSWVVGFVIALIFAVLAYLFWYVAVVLLGASVGASLGSGLMSLFGVDPGFLMGLVAVLFAIGAALLTMLLGVPKYLLIVLTALMGAGTVIAGVLLVFDQINRGELQTGAVVASIENSVWWSLVYIALAAIGMLAQFRSTLSYDLAAPPTRGLGGGPSVRPAI